MTGSSGAEEVLLCSEDAHSYDQQYNKLRHFFKVKIVFK